MALVVCGRREGLRDGLRNGFETTQNVFHFEDMSPSSSRAPDCFYVKQMKLRNSLYSAELIRERPMNNYRKPME